MQDGKLYKQVDEKHLYSEVDLMLWSPKMDLIAVTTTVGEVILHRLSWQKVWMLAQLKDSVTVTCIVWRPDGKVLCIGYSNGTVKLCSVEKAQCLYEHSHLSHAVTSLSWFDDTRYVQECTPDELSYYFKTDLSECFTDTSRTYLPDLPPLSPRSAGDNKNNDVSLLKDQDGLNLLLVGNAAGEVEIFAFGFIPISKITIEGGASLRILDMIFSAKLNHLSITSRYTKGSNLCLMTYSCPSLNSQKDEIKFLAVKLGQILNLEKYMLETLKQMHEVWEDILFEFESKLKKFANEKFQKHNKSLRYELLRLLIYGIPSDDLKCFLQFDLTKQSLTRLGSSVQNSYSHIKKLINQNFNAVVQAIGFHLNKLLGMSRWKEKFAGLGLDEKRIEATIADAGSLALKSNELLQVIDSSTRNFNSFYKWLYPVKLRLSGESVPHCMGEVSQQEVNFIVEFLNENFTSNSNVRLEKVGQYLRDDDLVDPVDETNNPWQTFLREASPAFKSATKDFIYSTHNKKSLIQVTKMLQDSLRSIITDCSSSVKDVFKIQSSINMINTTSLEIPEIRSTLCGFSVASSSDDVGTTNVAILPKFEAPTHGFYFFRSRSSEGYASSVSANVVDAETGRPFEVVDLSFYDDATLCLLVNDANDKDYEGCSKVIHLAISHLGSPAKEPSVSTDSGKNSIRNMSKLRNYAISSDALKTDTFRVVEDSRSSQFAVSGQRKVACILYPSRKRIRLFLTEYEDDADTSNSMAIDDTTRPDEDCMDDTPGTNSAVVDSPDDNDKENSALV